MLVRAWAKAYPRLFWPHDVQQALAQPHNHYFEWLAAVVLFHLHGYLSLQKYEFPRASKEKAPVLKKLLGKDTCAWLYQRQASRSVQCPDLLAYSCNGSNVFFCEVKGPRDFVRPKQEAFFDELSRRTGLAVRLLVFKGEISDETVALTFPPELSYSQKIEQ